MKSSYYVAFSFAALLISCTDSNTVEPDPVKPYTVAATYNFTDADSKESAARISMWQGFQAYLGKGNTWVLSADTVKDHTGKKFWTVDNG